MDASEARDFGLLDEVVTKKPQTDAIASATGSGDMSPPK